MTPAIRIYGTREAGSFGQLTRGLSEAARAENLLAGVYYYDFVPELDAEQAPGEDAAVGLHVGNPAHVELGHAAGRHAQHWLMLAPNSLGLRQSAILKLASRGPTGNEKLIDGLLAPSRWAAQVLRHAMQPSGWDGPVEVVPHAVSGMRQIEESRELRRRSYRDGQFWVLHVTTSRKQRKGTEELLEAWGRLRQRGFCGGKLAVLAHPLYFMDVKSLVEEFGGEEAGILLQMGMQLGWSDLPSLYSMAHLVAQPSRVEGFGLVPLEALCCGIPVLATGGTGHAEYLGTNPYVAGSVVIEHGPDDVSDDYAGATAPTVRVEDLVDALEHCRCIWEQLDSEAWQEAPALREQWSWPRVAGPGLRALVRRAVG